MLEAHFAVGIVKRRTLLKLLGTVGATALVPTNSIARSVKVGVAETSTASASTPEAGARSLNLGWRFTEGDITPSSHVDFMQSYMAAKAGGARGAAAPNYNDSNWRIVDLPHDWAIEKPPIESENFAQGYRQRGIGWYRRSVMLDSSLQGRYIEINFGAIATNATVWFNGTPVAHNWSGYNGFSIDVTALANFGATPNTLAVRVDAQAAEGWWYEGAGIYRDVWLVDRAPVSIVTDGVHADPRKQQDGRWRIPVEVTLYSTAKQPVSVSVVADLLTAEGAVIATAQGTGEVVPLARSVTHLEIRDVQPKLWSIDAPNLYRVRTRIMRDGKIVDERITPCGFRTIRFDAKQGFFLNDTHTKIKGVCLHQDHAGVGVAVPPALIEWRVRQLKAMGCNAIRCAHGAPDAALLNVCDRLGMLVMDENRNFNVSPEYIAQLEWLIRRDRNHPSVILWSVFNEEPLQGSPAGYEMVRRATATVKALDGSRPVTAAMSAGMFTAVNVSQAVDVVGFNYQDKDYDRFHAAHPDMPMMSSEDTSAFMTRGVWQTDKAKKVSSSDDTDHAIWGLSHRDAWKAIDTRSFMAGGFVWTGFDYHGEPTPYKWPANSSQFGILDLCGFPKSAFYMHRAMWIDNRPLLDILPHWNWPDQIGKPIKVMLATNLDRVELWLNSAKVGEGKPADRYAMIAFDVPYHPGVLEARGWKDGRLAATARVETTGAPVRLRLRADRTVLIGDGVDAQPVTIEALDAKGRPVPTANLDVMLGIENGRIIGVGNGDPLSLAPSKGSHVRLFNGLAQVIIQSGRGSSGQLVLTARAEGVRPDFVLVRIQPGQVLQSLSSLVQQSVLNWRQSPVSNKLPEGVVTVADNDVNSWEPIVAGQRPTAAASAGYIVLTTRITLSEAMTRDGAVLEFNELSGSGTVMIDGAIVARKDVAKPDALNVPIAPGKRDIVVALVLRVSAGEAAGLSGPVFIESRSGG